MNTGIYQSAYGLCSAVGHLCGSEPGQRSRFIGSLLEVFLTLEDDEETRTLLSLNYYEPLK